MPNQLHIPFKQTSLAHIKDAVQSYIEFNHTDAHPDAFKWDISRWEELRRDGVGGYVHVNRVDAAILLVFIHSAIALSLTYVNQIPCPSCAPFDQVPYERESKSKLGN